jgi:hypothetical protein
MTAPQPAPDKNDDRASATATIASGADQDVTAQTETEKESDSFLERETAGQVTDDNHGSGGQTQADQEDDSMRGERQAPMGPAPASDENIPDQLTHPRDANFTLPEMQHQGKNLTAESDPED